MKKCLYCEGAAVLIYVDFRGKGICAHGRQKRYCRECGGRELCKTPHCLTLKNGKYSGDYCGFVVCKFDSPVAWKCMMTEKTAATLIKEKFSNVTWKCDERVENECSRRRRE